MLDVAWPVPATRLSSLSPATSLHSHLHRSLSDGMSFESVKKFVYDRRRTILSATAFIGGAYLAGHYALRRLEEVRERLIDEKVAKEKWVMFLDHLVQSTDQSRCA